MATLDITRIHCVKKRDPIGKDEVDIYLRVDSGSEAFVSGPHFLDKSRNDDDVTLHIHQPFAKQVVVRLKERNGGRDATGSSTGNDLDLGAETFYAQYPSVARNISFRSDNGGVAYDVTIGVSA